MKDDFDISLDTENKTFKWTYKKCIILAVSAIFLSWIILFSVRAYKITKTESSIPLTELEKTELESLLKTTYQSKYTNLKSLPYKVSPVDLDVKAKAAILIDTSNGCILYEKNADEIIPPASMTKLFSMYVVFEDVLEGKLSFDQLIDLPPEAWASNAPPHSSLMFLGKGHRVTVDELLLGSSISSGNDAAYALAYATCGSMEAFIERMNGLAAKFNLPDTHFVESSGYSELNTTTARQMADFARHYITYYPDALTKYHSITSFTYPKKENMAPGDTYAPQDWSNGLPDKITMGITQQNTNPLLGRMDGVDGLKTGYIDESGYNLTLTAKRNGTRFLSVTMGGQGNNAREGNAGRVHDGTEMMEWAFQTFKDYKNMDAVKPYFVRVSGGKSLGVNIIPAYYPQSLTVPFIFGNSVDDSVEAVKTKITFPKHLKSGFEKGDVIGSVAYYLNDILLEEIPLVADRTVEKSNPIIRMTDNLIFSLISTLRDN